MSLLDPGAQLGQYEILAPLGEGGMGVVYRARDRRLGREVALKLVRSDSRGRAASLSRFEREARALAALNHPGISAIYGIDEAESLTFLILELVPGTTLARRLAEGPLPLEEGTRLCAEVASALHAAHQKDIVHRDLKPSNVMITLEGRAKLLDFGLAKAIRDHATTGEGASDVTAPTATDTGDGLVLGTAPYMSPEQARGDPLDRRSDVWSLGCLLYECLTGSRAFPGRTASDAIAAVLTGEPDWDRLPAATPPAVRALLRRCLEKSPSARLRDCGEAQAVLAGRAAFTDEGVTLAPPGGGSRRSFYARYRGCVVSIAWMAVMAVGTLYFGTMSYRPASAPAPVAETGPDVTRGAAPASEPRASAAPPAASASPPPAAGGARPLPPEPAAREEAAIRDALSRYAAAYETRDLELLKEVWPSFDDEERLAAAFRRIADWQVGIEVVSIRVGDSRARVVVDRSDVVNGTPTPSVRQTFTLVRSGARWVIDSVS